MIIVSIRHTEYKLASLKDAEDLLRIFNSAIPVESNYRLNGRLFHASDSGSIEIKILPDSDLLSAEEANLLIAEYEKGRIGG